jgi:uncharacterized membrane protein YoaK (UPF0700 family)
LAERAETLDAALLSFVAAFVDSCGFVGLFGLFTSHVTGNFVMIGAEAVQRHGELVSKILALPVFVVAVVATARAAARLRRSRRDPVAWLLRVEASLLVLAFAGAAFMPPPSGPDSLTTILVGMLAVAAMGLQNAMMRLELAALPATTVMTVTVTQAIIDAATLLAHDRRDAADSNEARRRFRRLWPTIAAFTAGAACGAGGYAWLGFWCLLLPAALCLKLAERLRTARA